MTPLENNTTKIQSILDTVNNLPSGGGAQLPAMTNPAGPANIEAGYEAIDGNGKKMVGTLSLGIQNTTQDEFMQRVSSGDYYGIVALEMAADFGPYGPFAFVFDLPKETLTRSADVIPFITYGSFTLTDPLVQVEYTNYSLTFQDLLSGDLVYYINIDRSDIYDPNIFVFDAIFYTVKRA